MYLLDMGLRPALQHNQDFMGSGSRGRSYSSGVGVQHSVVFLI